MVEERKNKLLDSPLYAFVIKGWVKWSQKIVSLQAGEEDFLLYLVWALDTIKEKEDGINVRFYDTVFNALRNSFKASQFNTNKDDLDYLTNLVCAAALASVTEILDKDLSGNARRVGRYLRQELAKLPHVKEVRGKGLLVGCEYDLPIAVEVKHEALERKVLFKAIGDQVNRMIPPLIASKKDVDQLTRVMRESIDEAAAKYLDMKMAG